jgi:predicted transcriptional regulator
MDKLTKQERAAMLALWKSGKGSIHSILEQHEEPKPHRNTLTSTLKKLEQLKWVGHKQTGASYEYFALHSKEDYMKKNFKSMLNSFFDSSVENLLSFIAKDKKLTDEEIRKIKDIINKK